MMKILNPRVLGLFVGAIVFAIVARIPIHGLEREGQLFLAVTLMTVIFWAFQVGNMGYVSGLYLALLVILNVAEPSVIFSPWTGSTMYFIVGAYLIASAVKHSGLGERIAMYVISKHITNFRSIIVVIFGLQILLSLIIPNSWARSLIIMAVMKQVIDSAGLSKKDAITIGLTVFTSSVPTSMLFLTGESAINLMIVDYAPVPVGWLTWALYMGPPAIAATLLTMAAILIVFKPTSEVKLDRTTMTGRFNQLGKLTNKEKRVLFWLVVAIITWMTDSWHGIDIGWATLALTMLMGLPLIGEVIDAKHWGDVPVHVLIFLTAAIAIGRVGAVVGSNDFLANLMFPSSTPESLIFWAMIVMAIAIVIHMFLGSVIAVLSLIIPATIAFTEPLGLNPLVPIFIVYMAVFGHFVFPFHHISIIVGVGDENGGYTNKEVMKLGFPLLIMVFVVVLLVQLPWWRLIGLL